MALNYGNYGIFLLMGSAGFISSTVSLAHELIPQIYSAFVAGAALELSNLTADEQHTRICTTRSEAAQLYAGRAC